MHSLAMTYTSDAGFSSSISARSDEQWQLSCDRIVLFLCNWITSDLAHSVIFTQADADSYMFIRVTL